MKVQKTNLNNNHNNSGRFRGAAPVVGNHHVKDDSGFKKNFKKNDGVVKKNFVKHTDQTREPFQNHSQQQRPHFHTNKTKNQRLVAFTSFVNIRK